MPGLVLGTRDIAVNKTGEALAYMELNAGGCGDGGR